MTTKAKTQTQPKPQSGVEHIPLDKIVLSPFNYRYFGNKIDQASLQELAASIKIHEVIQAITVRPVADGQYEIVVGERRFRASGIAGKKTIPAIVRQLSDEQVKEIQVIENLQREDPHPMAEAMGIQQLLTFKEKKTTVEEIAARIGKSLAYVYQRIKLNDLIELIREIYFAGAINTTQALKLARLDEGSQKDFYNSYCLNWQDEDWQLYNFNQRINNFQLELSDAPFDIKDAKLDKKAGACIKCPNNTAVTTSLFPEESEEARCLNRSCYENKCRLFGHVQLSAIFTANPGLAVAVPDDTVIEKWFANDDSLIKGRTILVSEVDYFDYYPMLAKPARVDFQYNDSEEDNEMEYLDAVQEYDSEVLQNEQEVTDGNYSKAILLSEDGDVQIVYLDARKESAVKTQNHYEPKSEFKAKDYQEAVKSKTLTLEMIEGEKQRLNKREERSKELDQIKLQENFYEALSKSDAVKSAGCAAGTNDRAVALFLLYDSLGWGGKQAFLKVLFKADDPEKTEEENEDAWDELPSKKDEELLHFFFNATENQVSLLTRLALLNKPDAKQPSGLCGQMLRLMVECTPGLDAAELVNVQRTVTQTREVKLSEKLLILDKQAEKLN